jgi:hypothetical protein
MCSLVASARTAGLPLPGQLADGCRPCRPRNEFREKGGKCPHSPDSQPLASILSVQGRSKAAISAAKIHRAAVTPLVWRNAYRCQLDLPLITPAQNLIR